MRTWGQIRFELTKFASGVDLQLVNGWISAAYHRILGSREWTGLEIKAWLETVAVYEDGTIAVTAGSNAVTGAGTTFTTAMSTRKLRVTGRNEWYTFTRTAATTGTLDRVYEGDTDAAAAYRIFQDEYQLPAAVKFIQLMTNLRINLPMEGRNERRMDDSAGSRVQFGEPRMYTAISDTPEASPPVLHRVALYPVPETAAGFPYTYQTIPTDFTGLNTSVSPLPWVSDDAVIAFAKGSILRAAKDYNGATEEDAVGFSYLSNMNREENERVGPSRIRMAARFVRHRVRRWTR